MPQAGRRILVVDDEEDLRVLLCRILSDTGYVVEWAGDGQEALAKLPTFQPDLLILDLMMPVMDGWQVLDRLRGTRSPRVVVLSALADPDRALKAGAARCLRKPFRFEELLLSCREVLDPQLAARDCSRPAVEGVPQCGRSAPRRPSAKRRRPPSEMSGGDSAKR